MGSKLVIELLDQGRTRFGAHGADGPRKRRARGLAADELIVIEGSCFGWLTESTAAPIPLEAGDVLVIPHGDPYALASSPGLRAGYSVEEALAFLRGMVAGELPPVVSEGGGGPGRLQVLCGFLGCDRQPFNPVLAALPRLLHLPASAEPGAGRLSPLIQFALSETRERRPGARCTLLRLSELLFVEAVRRYLVTAPAEGRGWLSGLRDPAIGRALAVLHERPAQAWTLARLAREVGCRARRWPSVLRTSWERLRCSTWLAGGSSSPRGGSPRAAGR